VGAGADNAEVGNGLTRRSASLCLAAVAVVTACFVFIRLGDPVLWADEADTACIASNILSRGLPVCWDHGFLVEAFVTKYAAGYLWNQHPWVMHYLMAASFAAFGYADGFAARFPFALLGLATVALTYLLARRNGVSRPAALLAAALLAVNVQFILFARQARYFALLAFFTTVMLLGYSRLKKRSGVVVFVLGAVGLFHSQYLTFFPIGAALWAWTIFVDRDRPKLKRLAVATLVILALTIPWMFMCDVFAKRELVREFSLKGFLIEFKEYAAKLNRRSFPLGFALLMLALALKGLRRYFKFYGLVALLLAASITFVVPVSVVRSHRYLTGFFPLLAVCAAMVHEDLWRWRRAPAVASVAVFLVTTLWSYAAIGPSMAFRKMVGYEPNARNVYLERDLRCRFLRAEYADFYRELRYGFQADPLARFLRLLEKRSRKDDLVVTSLYANQIDFYTGLPTIDYFSLRPEREKGYRNPPGYLDSPEGFERIWYMERPTFGFERFDEWRRRNLATGRLRQTKIDFDAPDIAVGNDPDLDTRLATRENLDQLPKVNVYLLELVAPTSRPAKSASRPAPKSGIQPRNSR